MKHARQRADQLLMERGLAASVELARALVMAGDVLVNGQPVTKAGALVATDAAIELTPRMPWVSRGAFKLLGALDHWSINVENRVCLDVGSSTGGFTDVLLSRGATRVHAVDAGAGQLDWRLRNDPRVVVHEGLNARYLSPADIGEPIHFLACDVSFISLSLILPAAAPLLASPREFVVLVKPQFEVARPDVGRGGIVRDPALHLWAVNRVRHAAAILGFHSDVIESPVLGAEGNKEFLLHGTDSHSRHHLQA